MSVIVNKGINFHNSMASKPANLQNSAVLRFLEEEEQRQRNGQTPNLKRVAWPPPPEAEGFLEEVSAEELGGPQFSSISSSGLQNSQVSTQSSQQFIQKQTFQSLPAKPSPPPVYRQSPASPLSNQSPTSFGPSFHAKRWAPVQSPVSPQPQFSPVQPFQVAQNRPTEISQPIVQNHVATVPFEPILQQYKAPSQQYQPQVTQAFRPPVAELPPPATTITLRPQAPVSQAPPPVFASQPATAKFFGGVNMRGDMKWPPASYKEQAEAENEARKALAKGPVFRPRKVKKDYSSFFAQHALNSTYPGYKAPPGTQYYAGEPGISHY